MKGQKEIVIETVKHLLPMFKVNNDKALDLLSDDQLEQLKTHVGQCICNGTVKYGKDKENTSEAMAYARSMVMNHLKKAKELNGNQETYIASRQTKKSKSEDKHGIKKELLPEDLKVLLESLQG